MSTHTLFMQSQDAKQIGEHNCFFFKRTHNSEMRNTKNNVINISLKMKMRLYKMFSNIRENIVIISTKKHFALNLNTNDPNLNQINCSSHDSSSILSFSLYSEFMCAFMGLSR